MRQETLNRRRTILTILIAIAVCAAFTLPAQTDCSYAKTKKPGKVVLKSVKAKSKTSVEVKWKKTSGAKGYQVYRAKGNSKKFKKIKTIKKKGTCKMTDKGLNAGTKYTYKVRAYKKVKGKAVYGKYSAAKSVTTKGTKALAQVEFTSAKAKSSSTIKLAWKKVSGAQGYQIYRCDATMNYSFLVSLDSSATEFIDAGLNPYSTYGYKIRAFRTSGGKNVYGKFSRERFDRTKEQTEPVVVDPETPQTEDPVIQEPQNPADTVSVDAIPEHPEINFSYLGTQIHIGQTWTEELMNEIQNKSSGMEKATREKIYYLSTVKNGCITDSAPFDVDIYFFDIGDYNNFLIVYVARGQILQWITNMADMGANGNAHMLRGCSDEEIPFSGSRYFRNILNITYPNAPEAKQGVLLGGFRFAVERDSAGNQILGVYENTEYKQNIPVEKRVAFHMVNAFRYLHGDKPLQYSMEFDGTGMTYTGYCPIAEENYVDQMFGAQAWAETMNASKNCSHRGPMPKGPLSTDGKTGDLDTLAADMLDWALMRCGENVGGMLRPYGEFVIDNYENSPGHIYTMLIADATHFAIGISGKYHIEKYILTEEKLRRSETFDTPEPVIKYNQWEASSDY